MRLDAGGMSSIDAGDGEPVRGHSLPRVLTPPLVALSESTSVGPDFVAFCASVGRPLLTWQREIALRLLELRDGKLRFRFALLVVGRQCGKSELATLIALWMLTQRGARLVVGTAQTLDVAREMWSRAGDLIESSGGVVTAPQTLRSNGKEAHLWPDGSRWVVKAANRRLRGLSADLVLVDELREHTDFDAWQALSAMTLARPEGLILAITSAGDPATSVVLNAVLAKGRQDAADPRYAGDTFVAEYSAPDGSDIDDPRSWAFGMPSLGDTVSLAAVDSLRATLPPAAFRTEVLGQSASQQNEAAVDVGAWSAASDPVGRLDSARGRLGACLDVGPTGQVVLAVAGQGQDGVVRVELAASWSSPEAAREELAALIGRIKPVTVGWFGPTSRAAPLAGDLARIAGKRLTKLDPAEACQTFSSLIAGSRVRHGDQKMLNEAVQAAVKLPKGPGWVIGQREPGQAVSAVYAASGAALLARRLPPPSSGRLIIAA